MKKHSIGKLVIMLVLMLAFVTGCANNGSKITIVGSSAMQLLAEQAGNDYRLSHQDSNIVVQGGGSGICKDHILPETAPVFFHRNFSLPFRKMVSDLSETTA